jgi:hypothetical protein
MIIDHFDYDFIQKGFAVGQLDRVIRSRTEGDTVSESAGRRLREDLRTAFRSLETL